MSKFQTGQIVRLDPTSSFYSGSSFGSNPAEVDGTVSNPNRTGHNLTVEVQWSNGTHNTYKESDLFSPEAEIGDTVQVTGAGTDDAEYVKARGCAYHLMAKGDKGVLIAEGTSGKSMKISFSRSITQYIPKEYFVLMKRGPKAPVAVPQLTKEIPMPIVEKATPKAPKLSYKKYKDDCNDFFKVDTSYSKTQVSFEPCENEDGEESPQVILTVENVKRLRKQLKNWLDANGHND